MYKPKYVLMYAKFLLVVWKIRLTMAMQKPPKPVPPNVPLCAKVAMCY